MYAICSECKNGLDDTSKKRKKRGASDSLGITKDCNDPRSQNHQICNLEPYCDDKYLTVSNLSSNFNKGNYVPQTCANCTRIICNKKQSK